MSMVVEEPSDIPHELHATEDELLGWPEFCDLTVASIARIVPF